MYPGLGWLIFRDSSELPDDLVFYENYLGKRDATFTLNFSTGSSMVLAQYYNFVRYGHDGYRYIMETMQANARALAEQILAIGVFELVGDEDAEQLPLVAFRLAEERNFDEFDIASQLAAERGWMVPAYTLPPNAEHVTIMRALVKQTLGHALATTLAATSRRLSRRWRRRADCTNSTAGASRRAPGTDPRIGTTRRGAAGDAARRRTAAASPTRYSRARKASTLPSGP